MDDVREILRGYKIKKTEHEYFKMELPAKDIAEMNVELMKKLGRDEEAKAFQYIVDHNLAESYSYASKTSKKYLGASEYVKRLSSQSD